MIYLDNAATTWPKPEAAAQAAAQAIARLGNPGRSGHALALNASRAVYACREKLASFFGGDALDYVFGMSCTDMLCQAIYGMAEPGCHIVTTCWEHNSVLRPLQHLAARQGCTYTVVCGSPDGYISAEDIAAALRPDTSLVIVNHAGNVTGAVQPVADIAALCRRRGLPLLVDGAQSARYVPIDLPGWGIDLFAFPGHKGLLGPQGCGGLYLAPGCRPEPLRRGGTGSMSLELEQPWEMPDRYESGTPPTPAICGLGAALDTLQSSFSRIRKREAALTEQLWRGLRAVPSVTLYGPPPERPRVGVISFNIGDLPASSAADALWQRSEIACRAGLHCAPLAHRALGTQDRGAVRFSVGPYHTSAQMDEAIKAVAALGKSGS